MSLFQDDIAFKQKQQAEKKALQQAAAAAAGKKGPLSKLQIS